MTVSVKMETERYGRNKKSTLPLYNSGEAEGCSFEGYDPSSLMAETAKLNRYAVLLSQ
jgi:hypothetical protein